MHLDAGLRDKGSDNASGEKTEAPEGMGPAHDAAADGVLDPVCLDIDDDLDAADGETDWQEQEEEH
nr:hypothetical protein [Devosia aurantiaca]